MSYFLVTDFRIGIDRRRPRYAAYPGSVWEATNCHLTRGGDLEKRKAFVSKYVLPAGETFGMLAVGTDLYVFGSAAAPSMPAGVTYQRLQHPDSLAMASVKSATVFDGSSYVVAEYSDGSVYHFSDGVIVSDFVNGRARTAMASNSGIAAHLAGLIESDTTYAVSVGGAAITIEAAVAGVPFTISAETVNKSGGTGDQAITLTQVTANVTGTPEVLATGSISITGGTVGAGVNKVSTITVNGVNVLGAAVDWATSNETTAQLVAAQINAYTSAPNYTATANGAAVTIRAVAGTGAGPNGYVVASTVGGTVTTGLVSNMAGGAASVGSVKQKYTATVTGTFEAGDKFTIIIDDKRFGYKGTPAYVPDAVFTHGAKVYGFARSLLEFSGVNDATAWNFDTDAGAGFINISSNASGSDTLYGIEVFQGLLALMSRSTTQIWSVKEDATLNAWVQTLRNTGTRVTRSVVGYGDVDIFYLSEMGVRSIRSRTGTNSASVADVGTPIDPYLRDYIIGLDEDVLLAGVATVDPVDGRYMLALGGRVFVLSYFAESKVSGWTIYEPGFTISEFATINDKLYCRSGDTIYLYGGDDGATYDSSTVTVKLPFLSGDKPGTYKGIRGVDIAAVNSWGVKALIDPRNEARLVDFGTKSGVSYLDLGIAGFASTTHIAPELTCTAAGPASISNIAIYYEGGASK